jgi:hypothetical protein
MLDIFFSPLALLLVPELPSAYLVITGINWVKNIIGNYVILLWFQPVQEEEEETVFIFRVSVIKFDHWLIDAYLRQWHSASYTIQHVTGTFSFRHECSPYVRWVCLWLSINMQDVYGTYGDPKIPLFRGYRRTLSADGERVLFPKSAVS